MENWSKYQHSFSGVPGGGGHHREDHAGELAGDHGGGGGDGKKKVIFLNIAQVAVQIVMA